MIPWNELAKDATIIFIIGCGTILVLIVFCLLAMVASLTFDCWWHLSELLGKDFQRLKMIENLCFLVYYWKVEGLL